MPRKPLLVQERAHALLVQVNRAAKGIKGSQYADLRRQLFKTSLSIVSNISEGREKESGDREFLRFLRIASGSAGELETQIRTAGECCLIPAVVANELQAKASEVAKMLKGLIKKICRDLGITDEGND
jgi:four helix bundle protein